jgi:hypothetical protein
MKRQELKIDKSAMAHGAEDAELSRRYPTPRYFRKRGCKLLKTKDGDRKKRGKRFQEAPNY